MPNFITLPRSQLYELVWSKPVTEVAKEFGISDVALAKRCRALNIPLPWRGYWAKVQAGQSPRRTPLPPFKERKRPSLPNYVATGGDHGNRDVAHLEGLPQTVTRQGQPSANIHGRTGCVSGEERSRGSTPEVEIVFVPRDPKPDAPPMSPGEAALRAPIDALDLTLPSALTSAHPAVLRTAVHLKHLRSRALTWPRGTRSGPMIEVRNVSESQQARALGVLDALLQGAKQLGWPFETPPPNPSAERRQSFARSTYRPPVYGHLIADGEPLQLRIDERQRQSDHVPTEQEKTDKKLGRHVWMPRFDYAPSGELRLHVTEPGHSYTEKVWKDTRAHPLEGQVHRILHGLLDLALERKQRREEQRRREIAARELERQQAIVQERRAANLKLIEELERQAGAWHRARFLRRYLRAAARAVGDDSFTVDREGLSIVRDAAQSCSSADRPAHRYAGKDAVDETSSLVGNSPASFLAWAEHYVNQLDPLNPEPRDPDFAHERTFQYGADEKRFAEQLQRLLGHAWEHALKLADVGPPASESN